MKLINFDLVNKLASEMMDDNAIATVISAMAMEDIPMSTGIIQLGIAMDILEADYHNGWSQED